MSDITEWFNILKERHQKLLIKAERCKGQKDEVHRELKKMGITPENLERELKKTEEEESRLRKRATKLLKQLEGELGMSS